ncbi:S41 family peptidase, partial [Verrucomicrobiota bacterium]
VQPYSVRHPEPAGVSPTGAVDTVVQEISEIGLILGQKNVVLNEEALQTAVVEAMIAAIDPHARILTKEQAERKHEEESGIFYGVGLKVRMKGKWPQIVEVMKDAPAADSVLAAGDMIEKIGEKKTEGMTLEEVINLLRGGKGEAVELWVPEKGETAELRPVKIIRAPVHIPVTGTMEEWPQQIGYVKVNGLFEGSGEQIAEQLEIWAGKKYFGMILDIRDANGVDLESVVGIASLFTKAGKNLFSVRDGHNNVVTNYQARQGKQLAIPLMVLINRGTSCSAETLAAVVQHCAGVMLIGTSTSGDNRIREAIPLADGRILRIATKHIDLRKGPSYCNEGVIPDVFVLEPAMMVQDIEPVERKDNYGVFSGLSEQEQDTRALTKRVSKDSILRRATDILLGIKALGIQVH